MEFLQGLGHFTIGTIVPFLFILTLIVFFHELGHFLVARWNGVTVKVFSIGFGPELLGFTDRRGTRWKLAAIPLGGYVRFLGDENVASAAGREAIEHLSATEKQTAFATQSVGRRAAIVAAGPIANFILATVIFAIWFGVIGRASMPAVVDDVLPDTPAAMAGFEPGDQIVAVNGSTIKTFEDFRRIVSLRPGDQLTVSVDRDGTILDLAVTPEEVERDDGFGGVYRVGQIGIQSSADRANITTIYTPFPQAIWEGFGETWFVVSETVGYIGRIITAQEPPDQLGGPITVARAAGEAASMGFVALLALAAYLSVSVGFVNLLPIPLLDGGHLLYFALEAIRRKPLAERTQEIGFRIGFVMVMALILFALTLDLGRLS